MLQRERRTLSNSFGNRRHPAPLGVSHGLVGEEGDVVTRLGGDEAHWLLLAGLAEEALSAPNRDREDPQPQLVDEVVLDCRTRSPARGGSACQSRSFYGRSGEMLPLPRRILIARTVL
jgi:hypothetical protein